MVLVVVLSSNAWTYAPNSTRSLLKSGLAQPVTIPFGLMDSDTPFGAGNWFRFLVSAYTSPSTISLGRRLYGRPCIVVLMRSLIVRIDRSISPTWSSAAVTLRMDGITSPRMHSNSPSACTSAMLKPLFAYVFMTACVSAMITNFFRLGIRATVRKLILREIVCRNGKPWTKKMSMHRETFRWCLRISGGTLTGSKVATCSELPLVFFPLIVAGSVPYIASALLASLTVTGQLLIILLVRMCSNCVCVGRPILRNNSCTLSAPSISRWVNEDLLASTVWTREYG